MSSFRESLTRKIQKCRFNDFGIENYDEARFGKYPVRNSVPRTNIERIKRTIKRIIGYKNSIDVTQIAWLAPQISGLQRLYENLNAQGKDLLIDLIAYRHMGYKKVKLKRNNAQYRQAITLIKSLADDGDIYDPHFLHFTLKKFDLKPIGYNLKLYFSELGVAIDFILEQYAYKVGGKTIVGVNKGDVVIDAGACWGDTALYFAHKVGDNGKVFSFEFIPSNIELFSINKSLNPHLAEQIELVEHPISNRSGDMIYYKNQGPGSKIKFQPFAEQTGSITTLTIDEFVKTNNIAKVDFIKMDIEGAEPVALEGTIETIKMHRPKLAIAIYHSMHDFVGIPNWILDLNLDYEIFIDHFTIHAEETVCYAKPRSK